MGDMLGGLGLSRMIERLIILYICVQAVLPQ